MLTRTETRQLMKLLDRAKRAVGEHAVEQAWRADAMKAIREKLVEQYHRHEYDRAHDIIHELDAAHATLTERLDALDATPIRVPRTRKAS